MSRALEELIRLASNEDQKKTFYKWWQDNVLEFHQICTITEEALNHMNYEQYKNYSQYTKGNIARKFGEVIMDKKCITITKEILNANTDETVSWYEHGTELTRSKALVIKP
jgi:hypothetical protein